MNIMIEKKAFLFGRAKPKFINGQLFKLTKPYTQWVGGRIYNVEHIICAYNKKRTKSMLFLASPFGDTPYRIYIGKGLPPQHLTLFEAELKITESKSTVSTYEMFKKIGYELIQNSI